MIFLVCTIMFLCVAAMLSFLMNRQIEETMAPAVLCMILVLYISGVSGNLLAGEYALVLLSIAALFYSLYILAVKHNKDKIKLIATPGFMAFLIFMVINVILCKGRMLTFWDEFSHWGRVTLNMYQWDKLGNCAGSTVMFPGYPPAVALWQYFFVCMKEKFSEPYLFAASNILAFIMLVPVYKKIKWKQWGKSIFLFGTIFLFPLVFYGDFWSLICVDGMLGIWLIYILYAHFSEKENTVYKILQISLALGIYPLVKASGSGLAILALLIIAADMLICRRQKGDWKGKVKILGIYACSILIGKQSWSWYLKLSDTRSAWNTSSITLKNIMDMLRGEAAEWRYTAAKNFLKAFFRGYEELNVFHWTLFVVFLAVLLYTLKIWSKKQMFVYSGCFSMCIIIYSFSLMLLYCFTFVEVEAVALASYARYMGSVLMGLSGFIICTLAESSEMTGKAMLVIILCLTVPFSSIKAYTINMNSTKQMGRGTRAAYENIKEFPDFMDWEKDKVWLIDQGSAGYLYVLGGYNATPVAFGPGSGWSLGAPLYNGDIWTVDYSVEEWVNALIKREYTYVYINHQDEQFTENYSSIFENPNEIGDRQLYRICDDNAGGVILKLYKQY